MRRILAISAVLGGVIVSMSMSMSAHAEPAPVPSSAAAAKPKAKPARTYKTCPSDKVWSESQNGCICAAKTSWDGATRKCVGADGKIVLPTPESTIMDPPPDEAGGATTSSPAATAASVSAAPAPAPVPAPAAASATTCGAGKRWSDAHNRCIVSCPNGKIADAKGALCINDPRACPPGRQWNEERMSCVAPAPTAAAVAATAETNAKTAAARKCPPGKMFDEESEGCIVVPKSCPSGREWKDVFDACVPVCSAGQVLDFHGIACHSIKVERRVVR